MPDVATDPFSQELARRQQAATTDAGAGIPATDTNPFAAELARRAPSATPVMPNPAQAPAEPQTPSFLDTLGRKLQLGTEDVGRGVAGIAGMPFDLTNTILDAPGRVINYATGEHTVPLLADSGSATGVIQNAAGALEHAAGAPVLVRAPTEQTLGTIIDNATQFAGTGGVGLAAKAPALAEAVGPKVADGIAALTQGTGSAAKDTAIGAGAGGGEVLANQVDPDHQNPYVDGAIKLASTILAAVGLQAPRAWDTAGRLAGNVAGSQASAERQAASRIQDAVLGDRTNAVSNIDAAADQYGDTDFRPTLGQASNNTGLIAQENGLRTVEPAPFMQRLRENNTTINQELGKLNPVEYIGDNQNPVADNLAAQRNAAIGQAQSAIDTANAALATAKQEKDSAAQAFTPTGQGREDASTTMRAEIQGAKDSATADYRDTLNAAKDDPENKLNFLTDNITAGAQKVKDEAPNLLLPTTYSGHIGAILGRLDGKTAMSMKDLVGLDQDLNQIMRQAKANNDGLTLDKLAPVKDAINQTLTEMSDPAAVAAAKLPEAQAALDQLKGAGTPTMESPDADIQAYIAKRKAEGATVGQALKEMQAPGGDSAISPEELAARTQTAQDRVDTLNNYASDPSYFSDRVGKYVDSRNTYRTDIAPDFSRGASKNVLAGGKDGEDYKLADGATIGQYFKAGPEGGRSMDQLNGLMEGRDMPQAKQALSDWVKNDLAEKVTRADGSIKPEALNSWITAHQEALDRAPDLKAEITQMRNRVLSASANEGAMEQAVAQAKLGLKQTTDEQNASAARFFIEPGGAGADPVKAVGQALDRGNARQNIAQLVRLTGQDTSGEATLGLRKAVYDNIESRITNAGSTFASADASAPVSLAKINKQLDGLTSSLAPLYSPEETATLNRVRDMVRTQSNTMLRGSVGSDTAEKSYMSANLARAGTSAMFGYKIAAVVQYAMKAMNAPMEDAVKRVMTRAYLDPAFGKELLTRTVTPAQKTAFLTKSQAILGSVPGPDGQDTAQ